MAAPRPDVVNGVELHPGLHSPGPKYALKGMCFADASKSSTTGKPTWGPAPRHDSHKLGRARAEEVRYSSAAGMREMLGHYSPGPQYALPHLIGGSVGNKFAAASRLQAEVEKATQRKVLNASQLGGVASFSMTSGSFADPSRVASPAPGTANAQYWRAATVLQDSEVKLSKGRQEQPSRKPWLEMGRGQHGYGQKMQAYARESLERRSRAYSPVPFRQLPDRASDP
jgi:hypothetical protein